MSAVRCVHSWIAARLKWGNKSGVLEDVPTGDKGENDEEYEK